MTIIATTPVISIGASEAPTLVISIGASEALTLVISTGVSEANEAERTRNEISPFRLRLQSK